MVQIRDDGHATAGISRCFWWRNGRAANCGAGAASDADIGFLDARSPDVVAERLRAFHQGLRDTGYVDGENVTILHRFAENQVERLPALAADWSAAKSP